MYANLIPPPKSTLFFTFDNIQTLLKSHRIGGEHQKKILAIVVCSILCTTWEKESNVQFAKENTPANWYTSYKYELKKDVYVAKLSSTALKECLTVSDEDEKLFNSIFETDIKEALDFVGKDMNENNEDTIDAKTKESVAKRRKLCENNHINDNVRSNRKGGQMKIYLNKAEFSMYFGEIANFLKILDTFKTYLNLSEFFFINISLIVRFSVKFCIQLDLIQSNLQLNS